MSERSEFLTLPIFVLHNWEPEGRLMGFRKACFVPSISKLLASSAVDGAPASPFLGYLFWRSKKGNWLSGHPRPVNDQLCSKRKAKAKWQSEMKSKQTIWLFDLDNTLHNASAAVFPSIANNMTRYITQVLKDAKHPSDPETVNQLRVNYLKRYGATLKGMVIHHGVNEKDFLREAHRFDHLPDLLKRERGLSKILARLPGKKILFTNAPQDYSQQAIRHFNLHRHFAAHISIENMRVHGKSHPKPSKPYLRKLLAQHGWQPSQCILVEDSVANIIAAKQIGIRTVMVTGHGQHVQQKSISASADITVKSVFELPQRLRQLRMFS